MSIQLALRVRAYVWSAIRSLAICVFVCSASQAHVGLDSPNGGESLIGGSSFSIEWHVQVEHTQLDWDLWYSTESNDGPWQEIAVDLATGDTSADSEHTLDWSVPNSDIPAAWVRVRQDNEGQDYFAISDSSFSIAALLGGADFTGDGRVNGADLSAWEQGFGTSSDAEPANGDADLDADVDGVDFLIWQGEYSGISESAASQSVPEPAATILLVLGMILLLWKRR